MDYGVVGFSAEMSKDLAELRLFLHSRMYRHYLLNRMRSRANRTVTDLFGLFMADPGVLPTEWFERLPRDGEPAGRARVVCDYIGGMTDRYAIEEHRRLFNVEAWG
jgi:dGTPase